jgi:hypothetical protein
MTYYDPNDPVNLIGGATGFGYTQVSEIAPVIPADNWQYIPYAQDQRYVAPGTYTVSPTVPITPAIIGSTIVDSPLQWLPGVGGALGTITPDPLVLADLNNVGAPKTLPVVPKVIAGAAAGMGIGTLIMMMLLSGKKMDQNTMMMLVLIGGLGGAAAGGAAGGGIFDEFLKLFQPKEQAPQTGYVPSATGDWFQRTGAQQQAIGPLAFNPLSIFKSLGGPAWSPLS